MPNDIVPAMGGHPAGSAMAYVGDAPSRTLAPEGVTIQSGGVPFDPDFCVDLTKDGIACMSRPVHGHVVCVGHKRSRTKAGRSTTEP